MNKFDFDRELYDDGTSSGEPVNYVSPTSPKIERRKRALDRHIAKFGVERGLEYERLRLLWCIAMNEIDTGEHAAALLRIHKQALKRINATLKANRNDN